MFTVNSTRKSSGRQQRSRRSAVYTAPSGREYVVEVVSMGRSDNSAQIVYQWATKKYVRAWVGAGDVEFVGRCKRCNGTGILSIRGDDTIDCPKCQNVGEVTF